MSPSAYTADPAISRHKRVSAFTLIELSIVLVIIGLIVGGILVGQDLIRSAAERATIAQVEKFNSAANTFFGKYGYLPGDIPAVTAAQFGFAARGQYAGEGDGNGVLEGVSFDGPGNNVGYVDGAGETVMFWSDLTYANGMNVNLIEGSFSAASSTVPAIVATSAVPNYFPAAKLGGGNYFYVYNSRLNSAAMLSGTAINFFGLSAVTGITNNGGCAECLNSNLGLTVRQAYDIDSKVDDGIATNGNVRGAYIGSIGYIINEPNSTPINTTACYASNTGAYYLAANSSLVNCALSFKMQAGD